MNEKVVFKCTARFFFFLYDSSDYNKTLYSILSYLHSVLFIVEGKGLALQPTVIVGLLVGVSFQSFATFNGVE